MSTIVNYKGNQLAIVNNGVATLNTKDTWVEDNIGLSVVSPTTTVIDTSTDTLHFKGGTVRDVSTGTAPVDESSYVTVQYGDNIIVDKSEQNCALTTKGTYVENDIVVTSNEPVTSTFESRNIENEDGSTTREFEFTTEADRFFDPNYPSGDCVTTLEKFDTVLSGRKGISFLYLPNAKELPDSFFMNSEIGTIYAPNLEKIASSFSRLQAEHVYIPKLNSIVNFCFEVSKIKSIRFETLKATSVYMFANSSIEEVIFDSLITLSSATFYNCTQLKTLVLMGEELCSLYNLNVLYQTPLRNGSGHIYVPQNLIEEYKTATNWVTLYTSYPDLFLPIEGSEYENLPDEEIVIPTNLKNIDQLLDSNYPYGTAHSNKQLISSGVCRKRTGIKQLDLPNAEQIENYAFTSSNIIEVNMPKVTYIGTYAFAYTDIKEINLDNRNVTIGQFAFYECNSLESFSENQLKISRAKFLINCTKLKKVYFPLLNNIRTDQFIENSAMEVLVLPSLTMQIWTNALRFNRVLAKADLYSPASLGAGCFKGCTILSILIIRKQDGVTSLSNIDAFAETSFAEGGTGGKVYVPQDLISQYKVATNWSTLVGYGTLEFVPIEDSEYEYFYADGTPIE